MFCSSVLKSRHNADDVDPFMGISCCSIDLMKEVLYSDAVCFSTSCGPVMFYFLYLKDRMLGHIFTKI